MGLGPAPPGEALDSGFPSPPPAGVDLAIIERKVPRWRADLCDHLQGGSRDFARALHDLLNEANDRIGSPPATTRVKTGA
jgi:hypothetical protein